MDPGGSQKEQRWLLMDRPGPAAGPQARWRLGRQCSGKAVAAWVLCPTQNPHPQRATAKLPVPALPGTTHWSCPCWPAWTRASVSLWPLELTWAPTTPTWKQSILAPGSLIRSRERPRALVPKEFKLFLEPVLPTAIWKTSAAPAPPASLACPQLALCTSKPVCTP